MSQAKCCPQATDRVAQVYTMLQRHIHRKSTTRLLHNIYLDNLHYSLLSTHYILCDREIHTICLPGDFYIYSMLQRHVHNKTTVRFLHGIFYVRQAYTQEINQKASTFTNTYPHSGWISCHLVSCGKCYRTCVCGVSARTNSVPRDSATQQTIFFTINTTILYCICEFQCDFQYAME